MDPNETLRKLSHEVAVGCLVTAFDYYEALEDWLKHGGFEPTWGDGKSDDLLTKEEFLFMRGNTA